MKDELYQLCYDLLQSVPAGVMRVRFFKRLEILDKCKIKETREIGITILIRQIEKYYEV